jgi:hypothetical protein
MKHSLQVSRGVAFASTLAGVLIAAVNPARAEEPTDESEKVELAAVDEEVTAPVPTGGGTSQPAYQVAPDSSRAPAMTQGGRREPRLGGPRRVAPAFSTTVVCGFVEETSAVCWQYSPAARAFIKIGEWQT